MNAIIRALEGGNAQNKVFELLVIHGSSDFLTRNVYRYFVDRRVRQIFLQKSDELTLLRSGLNESRSSKIVFVLGGHIVGCQWLESICSGSLSHEHSLYVPEFEVCFGKETAVTRFLSSYDKHFEPGCLMEEIY